MNETARQLLMTKMFTPRLLSNHIERPQLISKLGKGLEGKLILLSAPAGFGKTTLLSEWKSVLEKETLFNWVTLDSSDNEPGRLVSYIAGTLQLNKIISSSLFESIMGMVNSPSPPLSEIYGTLLNELTLCNKDIILCLDDFHLIESTEVMAGIETLIEWCPPNLTVVMSTRDDPQLPLPRMRARGELLEIRAAELRFSSNEIEKYIKTASDYEPDESLINQYELQSEGWITGIKLALTASNNEKVLDHQFTLDYLVSEVLSQQSDEIRQFLIKTSLFHRFNSDLCDVVLDQNTSGEMIDLLLHSNLFLTSFNDEGLWFRYHNLFSDLLQIHNKKLKEAEKKEIQRKASKWFRDHDLLEEAVELIVDARLWDEAAELIEEILKNPANNSSLAWRWLNYLPEETIKNRPYLSLIQAWYSLTKGDMEKMENCLRIAEESLENDDSQSKYYIAVIQALKTSFRGNFREAIKYARTAMENLSQTDQPWRSMAALALGDSLGLSGNMDAARKARISALEECELSGNAYLTVLNAIKLATNFRMQGDLAGVNRICSQYHSYSVKKGIDSMPITGCLLAIWAEALGEIGDYSEALEKADEANLLIKGSIDMAFFGWSIICIVRVKMLYQRNEEASDILKEAELIMQGKMIPPLIQCSMSAIKIRLFLLQDRVEEAELWCDKRELHKQSNITPFNISEFISYGRVLLALEKYQKSLELLDQLYLVSTKSQLLTRTIEILIIKSLLLKKQNKMDGALASLEEALKLSKSCRFISLFTSEGSVIASLLLKATENNDVSEYAKKLLSAFPVEESQEEDSVLFEKLSDRELAVLELLAKGLSRKEIADSLFISPHTTKSHLRNIYGKLSVNSATQAVAKARSMGMLEQ